MPNHPTIQIRPGHHAAVNPNRSSWTPYEFENIDNGVTYRNSYHDRYEDYSPAAGYPGSRPASECASHRVRTISAFEPEAAQLQFPEAQLNRSFSTRSNLHPHYSIGHRNSKSEVSIDHYNSPSRPDSIADFSPQSEASVLTDQISNLTLDSDDGLRRFQENQLSDADEAWYRLVPPEAQKVLDKNEVQRQSTLFEVFKSEKDYVHDLDLIQEVFVTPLMNADPPVLPAERLHSFVAEVFFNLESISAHHHRMLAVLFERQREQHPLVQSVADIILDSVLLFRGDYESYIKHYPLAEAQHRSELRKNKEYHAFIQKCAQNRRISKRDLITFLSRPVTRLPRLCLVLDHTLQLTQPDHPDLENLPLILNILNDFVKSTQPGIAAAESKVKFWSLSESLVYMKGEIIEKELDLYDESRTLVYSGSVARRSRSDVGHGWIDLHVALLDNYLLLTREEKRANGIVKYHVTSRPIPLEYLRLASFNDPPESRREKLEDACLLDSFRAHYRPVYPFTVYHASAKSLRRYTLFTNSDAGRNKWYNVLLDAIAVRKARGEANLWFAPQDVHDGFFRSVTSKVPADLRGKLTGRITTMAQLFSGGRKFLVMGCATGIYAGLHGDATFRKVLSLSNPTSMHALQDFNKIVIHHEAEIIAYSSDILARYAMGYSSKQSLDATYEKVAGREGSVLFCRAGQVGRRTMLIFASKSFLQVTIYALEAINAVESSTVSPVKRSGHAPGSASFRSFGDYFSVPKDAFDVMTLVKTIGICTEKGIIILDPTNFASGPSTVVPDFAGAHEDAALNHLKTRCEPAKPLGLVRCDNSELMVVYDELGCFVTKHGKPSRSCGYMRWETKATSFVAIGAHVLLFSPEFIEIRHATSGKLVQVIQGQDIQVLWSNYKLDDSTVLIGMKGENDDEDGASHKIVELVETREIMTPLTARNTREEAVWDTWDSM